MRVNFFNSEMFKWKFKREPKKWTIEQVHDLWILAKKRSEIRRKRLTDYINNIPNVISPNDKGEYILYYQQNKSIYAIIISFTKFERYGSTWSYHTESLKNKDRESTLEYWISSDNIIDMGNEFIRLSNDRGFNSEARVNRVLSEMIDSKFRKHFKELKKHAPESFITTIGDKKYIIYVDDRMNYAKFRISSEVETINI